MKTRLTLTIAALLLSASSALALTSQEAIDSFAAQGYTRVEVKTGPTQMKVEAIRGTEKLEVIYDNATGAVLKSETEAVERGDDTAPGFEISNRNRDFLDDDDLNDDDDDDDDGHGRGRGRGRGGDDDRDDDRGGDDDDDHDDDHSGRGRGGDDD